MAPKRETRLKGKGVVFRGLICPQGGIKGALQLFFCGQK